MLVFAFALSWVWTTLGLVLRTPNAVMSIGFVVLFPLTFLSNIFVDPDTMPWGCAHSSTSTRYLTWPPRSAGSCRAPRPPASCCGSCGAAAALTALFAPLTMRLYRNRG